MHEVHYPLNVRVWELVLRRERLRHRERIVCQDIAVSLLRESQQSAASLTLPVKAEFEVRLVVADVHRQDIVEQLAVVLCFRLRLGLLLARHDLTQVDPLAGCPLPRTKCVSTA